MGDPSPSSLDQFSTQTVIYFRVPPSEQFRFCLKDLQ
jgi:hypothetical protein